MELIMMWLFCACVSAMVTSVRGASVGMGFFAGLLLGPIGVAVAFIMPPKTNT